MTKKIKFALGAATTAAFVGVAALVSFASAAWAADGAVEAGESLPDLARPVLEAILGGKYWYAAALALVFVVAALQRYGERLPLVGKYLAWAKSDWGAPLLVMLASVGGALATALAAGTAPSWGMLGAALGIAAGAAGGWKFFKELGAPVLRSLQDKLPPWARPLVSLLLWAVDRPDRAAEAAKAGDAAVAANPPTGAAGVIGEPTELP